MADPYRAFKQLERELFLSRHDRAQVRPEDCELIATIVYDRRSGEIRYERPKPEPEQKK